MFSFGVISVFLMLVSGLGHGVFWWSVLWGCIFMCLMSLGFWYSPAGVKMCWGESLMVDQFSLVLITLTIMVSALSMLGSVRDVSKFDNNPVEFTFSLLLLTVVLVLSFSVSNFLSFYIMFESSLILTLLIILGWGYQPERLQAGKYMLLYTVGASLPLLVFVIVVLAKNGSVFWGGWSFLNFKPSWLMAICACLAFLVKLPIYGFHLWLPKAHVEAPVAGSMVLAGVLLKLGGYGLIRVFYSFQQLFSPLIMAVILCISLVGGIVASMMCFVQNDVKAFVAYSSVGHMSLVLGGIFTNTEWGWFGSLMTMLTHGLCSSGMFFLANETYMLYKTRSLVLIKGGLALAPGVALCWFLMCSINMPAPPSLNFWAELTLGISIFSYSTMFSLLMAIMMFLSGFYSLYLCWLIQHGQCPLWVRGVVVVEVYIMYVIVSLLVFILVMTTVCLMLMS